MNRVAQCFLSLLLIHLSFEQRPVLGAKRSARPEDLDSVKLLQGCLNDQQPDDRWGGLWWMHGRLDDDVSSCRWSVKTSWERAMSDSRSRYRVVGTWWPKEHPAAGEGAEPKNEPSAGVTVVTHVAFEDRQQLKNLCRSWQVRDESTMMRVTHEE